MTRQSNRALRLQTDTVATHAKRMTIKRQAGQMTAYPYDARTTELLTMLRAKRPAGTATEQAFVDQWIAPLGTIADDFGNHWLTVGEGSRILWSSHTDTVHDTEGAQYVGFTDGCAYVARSNCLGSDDTTGVWLMRQMILANVPGTYVFHREEEIGGNGSSWIAAETPERLAGLDFAIAFDRKGYCDIVTNQQGTTASETFAHSLAECLENGAQAGSIHYEPADGIFTDTQNYAGLISECSNISVGYHAMHKETEWQDVDYAMRLLDALIAADFSGLTAERNPLDSDFLPWYDRPAEDGYADPWRDHTKPALIATTHDAERWADDHWRSEPRYSGRFDRRATSAMTLDSFCAEHPDTVSDFLTTCGFKLSDLLEYSGID